MRLALVHSPLVGPSTWRAVANAAAGQGHAAHVVECPPLDGLAPDEVGRRIGAAVNTPSITVLHSAAGGLAPGVTAGGPFIAGVIFADAILPYPGQSWMETAPSGRAEAVRAMARDGLLPPWNRWLPDGVLAQILPDARQREAFVAELPQAPLAYLEARANLAMGALPCGYLQLSGAYDAEASEAGRRGWPTRRLDLHHLAMMTHPAEVLSSILDLAGELTPT